MQKIKNIAIIGAGPTGIFTALFLKNFSGTIHLIEKNTDIGEKLKLTGGGRMNVTNELFTPDQFFSSDKRRKDHFCRSPYFTQIDNLLEQLGMEYIWEKQRAILQSQNAKKEVARLKEKILKQENIKLLLSTKVLSISPDLRVKTHAFEGKYDSIICTTGGMFQIGTQPNRQNTYGIFESLGHSIQKPSPSLSPFRFIDNPFKNLSGISFEGILFSADSQMIDDMLLTHFGLSGPGVLDFSALWDKKSPVYLSFTSLPKKEVQKRFKEIRESKMEVSTFLKSLNLSKRIINFLLEQSNIMKKYCAEYSKTEEQRLIETICAFPLPTPILFPYPGCWTTKGGISLNEIHMHSLESKLINNLYFGGELVDIDGMCGGYHISLAAICGKIIAEQIVKKL